MKGSPIAFRQFRPGLVQSQPNPSLKPLLEHHASQNGSLTRWVEAHGGYLHDKLMVVENTPQSRCRGIVARVPLTLPDLHQLPCMAVPEALYMSSRQAEQLLDCHPPSPTAVSAAHLQLQLSSRVGGAGGRGGGAAGTAGTLTLAAEGGSSEQARQGNHSLVSPWVQRPGPGAAGRRGQSASASGQQGPSLPHPPGQVQRPRSPPVASGAAGWLGLLGAQTASRLLALLPHGRAAHHHPGHQAAPRLQPAVSDLQALPPLSTVTKLACLLAHERAKGEAGFWWPYIAALPCHPPCAWALPPSQLHQLLAEFGAPTAWAAAVEAAGQAVRLQASLAAALYGHELGVDVDDVVWAAGQVLSRSFGNQEELALAPLIDLLNHQQGAARPQGFEDEDRGETIAYVTSSRHGHPAPLAAGEELFIQVGGWPGLFLASV
ncbi:hypothetical protein V8C86DRAFT_2659226 [Haematococcus lacustris]